jgi:hypothetical protein
MSQRGKRFPALCGDGKVRAAVVTAAEAWCVWSISAAVQVTVNGKRRTVFGNLTGAGIDPLPPGVSHRFLSNRLTALVGFTDHRPRAPLLRRLMGRAFGSTSLDYAGEFAFLTAAALYQIHGETFDGYRPGAGNGEPFTRGDFDGWQRDAVRKLSAGTLKRLTALAWRAHKFGGE